MNRNSITLFLMVISTAVWGQRKNWALPDFGVVQYAGSIGFVSVGAGYDVFKSKARFSMHYGFIPSTKGGPLNVLTTKFFYKPKYYSLSNRLKLNPFDIGIMGSFHYGDNFEERWPDGVHPKGYYWWHPAIRLHIAMETSLTYLFPKDHRFTSITGYYEFNTNELYLVSYIKNARTIKPWDIVKLGAGVRVSF